MGKMLITAQLGSRQTCSKKPPPKQGPWIVLPGDGSASLRDRPVFPEWVLYDFQPLGIRLPGGL